jgi:hypothetical protein
MPISTKWTLDAAGETGRSAIKSVYMIVVPNIASKGTGFLLSNGYLLTNEHVIRGSNAKDIFGISSFGEQIQFTNSITDKDRDLCLLKPQRDINGGLKLGKESNPDVGSRVYTWGYPLGYNGPSPLLSVGYLAGYQSYNTVSGISKRLIVNGAFNPGNSGGPLFLSNDDHVIGVVTSKHVPISPYLLSAINALALNRSGIVFTAQDDKGNIQEFVESQLVAEILTYFRSLTQVMIGEAISIESINKFLNANNISITE